ncbi:MAG: 4Fe-4S dicluster domain-containing protein [Candidatus Limiplasma sp.]|nr:4Fe-4S dicluster domain-containing protein [Candidatus Limiplasma sp.]
MRLFDTDVQKLKYDVLREVARHAYDDRLADSYLDIPKLLAPGPKSTMRCCIYKERAILAERVKLALGGNAENPNVVEVIGIACDECPVSGYQVGHDCRGCIAHRCMAACPRNAISLDENRHAHIDPALCIGCGKCAAACPYSAIANHRRPCENACKVDAIHMGEDRCATINAARCTGCGACVYQCPFGAIQDKSFLVQAIRLLRESKQQGYRAYAIVAPSISSQFGYAKLGQVIAALKRLGFHSVVEAALGADRVAWEEARELSQKGFVTSSCCPAFVQYIRKAFPQLEPLISHNLSPMAEIARYLKQTDPTAKTVFIGPCTAKKQERALPEVAPYVDCVLTFEELQAWIDSRDFDLTQLEEDVLDNASFFGRIFARSGGLSDAVAQALREQGDSFALKPAVCDGIEACRTSLLKKSKGMLPENFIEGMACVGGCIGGAGCLTHGAKNRSEVDRYGQQALEKTIAEALTQCSFPVKA